MGKLLNTLVEKVRTKLGIKTDYEIAMEEYEEDLRIRKKLVKSYKKGLKNTNEKAVKESLGHMFDICEQKTHMCDRNSDRCGKCLFGLIIVNDTMNNSELIEEAELDYEKFRQRLEKKEKYKELQRK